jgi:hypothetical protein
MSFLVNLLHRGTLKQSVNQMLCGLHKIICVKSYPVNQAHFDGWKCVVCIVVVVGGKLCCKQAKVKELKSSELKERMIMLTLRVED